jgi:hypothetical protein
MTHAGPEGTTSANSSRRSQGDDQGPPHTSPHLHAYALADRLWVAHALSHYTPVRYGRIASVSVAQEVRKFGDSICLVCVGTLKCLFIRTQPTRALTDIGGGYHLGAPNFRSDHCPFFPSNILPFPLISPPGLQLFQYLDHLAKPHRTSIDTKGPIMSGFQPLDFYRCLYN